MKYKIKQHDCLQNQLYRRFTDRLRIRLEHQMEVVYMSLRWRLHRRLRIQMTNTLFGRLRRRLRGRLGYNEI